MRAVAGKGWRKKYNNKYLRIFSKHPSHRVLRLEVPTTKPIMLRLGSKTPCPKGFAEINSVEATNNSSNKLKMKQLMIEAGCKTPAIYKVGDEMEFPVLAKRTFRSRGKGMFKLDDQNAVDDHVAKLITGNNYNKNNPYYFERFRNFNREYRIHVSAVGGYFYACRKVLKTGAENKWFRNDSNSAWLIEENPSFDKPSTWKEIVEDCQKARKAIGLDICCFDVKVSEKGNWMILESNSAPSFGEITAVKYINELKHLIKQK